MLTRRRIPYHKRRAESAPSPFDFTAGGLIPASNCLQAFDPFVVQDLQQSYVDLSPNNNQPIVTVSPTLDVGGWLFNGTNQYIDTDIYLEYNYSIFATYSYLGAAGAYAIFGVNEGIYVYPYSSGSTRIYYEMSGSVINPPVISGIAGVSGEEVSEGVYGVGYINGVSYNIDSSPFETMTHTLLIGAMNNSSGSPYRFGNSIISRFAVYDIPLSAAQAAALSTHMSVE